MAITFDPELRQGKQIVGVYTYHNSSVYATLYACNIMYFNFTSAANTTAHITLENIYTLNSDAVFLFFWTEGGLSIDFKYRTNASTSTYITTTTVTVGAGNYGIASLSGSGFYGNYIVRGSNV